MQYAVKEIRPTRQRLQRALGLAACIVSVLLVLAGMLLDVAKKSSPAHIEESYYLTVQVRPRMPEPTPEHEPSEQIVRSAPHAQPAAARPEKPLREFSAAASPEVPAETPAAVDWHALTAATTKTNVDEFLRSEKSRATMLRQSHSVMFLAEKAPDLTVDDPLLADLRFIPRVHVLGLGITLGSCFIGIPIAGVPVEQRTVAITLFVCARESG